MEQTSKRIEWSVSDGFARWISQSGGSVAVSTYQAGKIVLIGWDGQQVSVLLRDFNKPMGLAVNGCQMAVACRNEIVLLSNAELIAPHYPEQNSGRYDALFLPRAVYYTGDLSIHDIAFGGDGLWMINTRFSCLSVLTEQFSFSPRWRPPFITHLTPEDRCHLNGLAMCGGKPRFVTAHGETNVGGAWRSDRVKGGALIDVETGESVIREFCMPHSPRQHNDRWWILNSGQGELCVFDPEHGACDVVCSLPGYVRGLSFVDDYAIIGLSKIRSSHLFDGLPIQDRFKPLICAVAVVDLKTGTNLGMFQFTEGCEELYDVQFIPGISKPSILNQRHDAIRWTAACPS